MAMKLGGGNALGKVTAAHFDAFVEEVALGKPMVRSRLRELAEGVLANLPTRTQAILLRGA
jgi:hypothetical protein